MSIDNSGELILKQLFGNQLSWMYAGIEATLDKESGHSCALLLSTYTEVMGGVISGNLKDSSQMRNNYVEFLEYLGNHYVDLHEKYDLYKIVRNKLVHEFSPRPSYIILYRDTPNPNIFGIEIVDGTINFNLKEYYRDFKNGVEKLGDECAKDPQKILNIMKITSIDFENVLHKPKN